MGIQNARLIGDDVMSNEAILAKPTLVLNRNWQPVHVTSVRRALVMVCRDSACVVDPLSFRLFGWRDWLHERDNGPIRSANLAIEAPEVVALSRFDRLPNCAVSFSKRNVLRRDRYTCQYCGQQPGLDELSIDHVVPRASDGPTSWENCVAACVACNHLKAARTLGQSGLRLQKQPTRPEWQPLFSRCRPRLPSWAPFLGAAK